MERQLFLGDIAGINARLIQNAQIFLRRFMQTGNIDDFHKALLCLRFPLRHSYRRLAGGARDVIHASMLIRAYAITGEFRTLEKALKILGDAERYYWQAMRILKQHPQPVPPLETPSFWLAHHDEIENFFRMLEATAASFAIGGIIGWLSRATNFIKHPAVSQYLPAIIDDVWRTIEGPLWRKAPAAARRLWQEIQNLRRILGRL